MSEQDISKPLSSMPMGEASGAASLDRIEGIINRFLETADVRKAIGEPIQAGDRIIIPTAEVVAGMGFGMGSGSGPNQDQQQGTGSGGGGGGNAFSRPVAVIVAGPNGVEVTPVFDVSKIALTAITAFGFMLATIGRFRRGPRSR